MTIWAADRERGDVLLELGLENRERTGSRGVGEERGIVRSHRVVVRNPLRVVAGIEELAAVDLGQRAVNRIGTRLGDLVDDSAACTPILRREVRGLEADFLEFVIVGDSELRTGDGDVVVLKTVNQKVVGPRAPAIDRTDAAIQRTTLV